MGNRLTKIYTRTGDDGTTGLGDGTRVTKSDLRIRAMGAIDELNAHLGVLLSQSLPLEVQSFLTRIQHQLFDLGGELCLPGQARLPQAFIALLEESLDKLNDQLTPLKEFILPGGHPAAAQCHVARVVCRRAESLLVELASKEQVNPISLRYLNRLSDLLFVVARYINKSENHADVLWQPNPAK